MDFTSTLPIILILGAIGLYLLLTGVAALVRGRMRVANPLAQGLPTSLSELALEAMRRKAQADYPVPAGFIDGSASITITGGALRWRAGLHIVSGLLVLLVLAVFVDPELMDRLMGWWLALQAAVLR